MLNGLQQGFMYILDQLNIILWEWPCMLVCFLAAGLYFSVGTGWFQFRRMGLWLKKTWGELVRPEDEDGDRQGNQAKDIVTVGCEQSRNSGISQRQSICTALAATVGTGNIVGVATAIVAGGPGAVFWMWVSAFLGMMTGFAEKVLGNLYRKKGEDDQYLGGPMTYMEDGLHARWLAVCFAFLCMVASFGVGNMTQVQAMASSLDLAFGIPSWITGMVTAVILAVVLVGGIRRIGAFTEKLVPFMVVLYMGSAMAVLISQARQIPEALLLILREAFRLRPALGGMAGYGIARAMRIGVARGTFTHEAGVGSSVFAHSAADTKEPVQQGMWGIFEVFVDTIVVCTVTALVILTTGLAEVGTVMTPQGVILGGADMGGVGMEEVAPDNIASDNIVGDDISLDGAALTMVCFERFFPWGQQLIAVCLTLFGFGSLIGWSYYGERAAEYLFGTVGVWGYKLIYVMMVTVGSVASLQMVWKLADVCNGLMALPNLAAVFLLRGQVIEEMKRYEKNHR